MSRWHSYLNTAKSILSGYKGEEPLANFLRNYFSQHKKIGSTDRRWISQLCYCYFRLGKSGTELPAEERIMLGFFLCTTESNPVLENLKPEWNEKVKLSIVEKYSAAGIPDESAGIFPWRDEMSENIDHQQFCKSFLVQPDLFLRIRPGYQAAVTSKIKTAGIEVQECGPDCLALPNASKIDTVIEIDKEAVVQDLNSQRTSDLLNGINVNSLWDCCAASGGKSIMVKDKFPDLTLTVTDIRQSILQNLQKRFSRAGISDYRSCVLDLSTDKVQVPRFNDTNEFPSSFPLIIADVPCTGSGTWARTPEQLYYFDPEKIEEYSKLQRKIVSNVIPHLAIGGHLLYITCSVYRKENEENIRYFVQQFGLKLLRTELFTGYDKKADTLFAAILSR